MAEFAPEQGPQVAHGVRPGAFGRCGCERAASVAGTTVGDPMWNWMNPSAVARGAFMSPTVPESDSPRSDQNGQLRNS